MTKSFFTSSMFACLVCAMLFLTLTLSSLSSNYIVTPVFFAVCTLTMTCLLPKCSTNS